MRPNNKRLDHINEWQSGTSSYTHCIASHYYILRNAKRAQENENRPQKEEGRGRGGGSRRDAQRRHDAGIVQKRGDGVKVVAQRIRAARYANVIDVEARGAERADQRIVTHRLRLRGNKLGRRMQLKIVNKVRCG